MVPPIGRMPGPSTSHARERRTPSGRSASASATESADRVVPAGVRLSGVGPLLEGAYFDPALEGLRGLLRPLDRRLVVVRFDDPEAAEVFLGLGERTVGEDRGITGVVDRGRSRRRVQAAGKDPGT